MLNTTTEATVTGLANPVPGPHSGAGSQPSPTAFKTSGRSRPLQSSSAAAYAKALRAFTTWGGRIPCNAETLHKFIRAMRRKVAPRTIFLRVMAVRHSRVAAGLRSPTDDHSIRSALRSLQLGYPPGKMPIAQPVGAAPSTRLRQPKSAKPITRALLLRALDAMHRNSLDRRDRALLLLGFVGALKRTELVSIKLADLCFTTDALIIKLKGRQVAIPKTGGELCAATAVRNLIDHTALDTEQPNSALFRRFDRGGDATTFQLQSAWVSVVLKNRLKAVGIDPTPFSAQSLRAGRLAEAAKGVL